MRLMKEDVEMYIKRIAWRNPTAHVTERETWAEIWLARKILDQMDIPYEKEENASIMG
jgi:hypothetical protein